MLYYIFHALLVFFYLVLLFALPQSKLTMYETIPPSLLLEKFTFFIYKPKADFGHIFGTELTFSVPLSIYAGEVDSSVYIIDSLAMLVFVSVL